MEYKLSPKHQAYYNKLEADSILQIKDQKVSAVNGAVLYSKLLQAASGAVYDENGKYVVLDEGRYELIADLVEQRQHSIVFFNWAHQRDMLVREFEARGISFAIIDGNTSQKERVDVVKFYQAGFYRVVLLHPQSAAHGLTFTKATTTIWTSPTPNLEHFVQGNRRAYRAGQLQRTETITILAAKTIDSKVYTALQGKNVNMSALLKELAG
jgi:SNF2 family DNA or RNA helicase